MQTFAQKLFFMFGLRRRMAARRTPAALQVDYSNVIALPAPANRSNLRIVTELRDGGLLYVKPLANEPRTA